MTSSLLNYLLNALWQAPLLFAAAWLLSFAVRRLGPHAEHRLWVITLLVQVVLPACSVPGLTTTLRAFFLALLGGSNTGESSVIVSEAAAQPLASSTVGATLLQAVIVSYIVVLTVSFLYFALQSLRLKAVRRDTQPVALPAQDAGFFSECLHCFSIAEIRLACAPAVTSPITYGLRRPQLLLPCGFAEQVSQSQLRVALAHELAHVCRKDYAKHLLYRLLAMPLCFHPAIWTTLSRITDTREQICDGMAANLVGGPRPYAKVLLELATLLTTSRSSPAHAIGIFDASRFERRILMLHQPTRPVSLTRRLATVTAIVVFAVVACTSAVALRLNLNTPSAPVAQEDSTKRVKIAPGIAAGQIVHRVQPKYPEEAKKAKIQGIVLLHAVIGKDGSIHDLSVLSGPEELRVSAIDAVRQWTYKPYLLNGEPTEVETTITVNYSLGDAPPPPTAQPSASANPWPQGTVPPKVLSEVSAVYPPDARHAKIGGEVIVSAKVGSDGSVSDVAAVSGPPEFRASAADAVRHYVFQPATVQGKPVPVDLRIAVKFEVF